MTKGLLEGGTRSPEELEEELQDLRMQVRGLKQELKDANDALEAAKSGSVAATRAMENLRKALEPIHRALKMVFRELDAAGIKADDHAPEHSASPSGASARWQSFKKRFPGRPAELIDLLLELGEMKTTQIATALRCDSRTVSRTVRVLNKAGVIAKNEGRFSLKES